MELRGYSQSHLHLIKAIRFGRVEKVPNVDYRGRPGLKFKALKDVYEEVNRQPNLSACEHMYKDTAMDSGKRKTRKRDIDTVNFRKKSRKEDDGSDSDELTLTQLKQQRKSKKRKVSHFDSVTVKQEYVDLQPEDETDISETIISWKSKVSKKSKGRKKSPNKYALILNPVKSEPILTNEDSLQSGVVGLPSAVEVEVSVSECLESAIMISEASDSSVICSGEVHLETSEDVKNEPQSDSQLSLLKEDEVCILNDVYYDYMEHNEDDVFVEYPDIPLPQLANAPYSEDKESINWDSNLGEVFPEADLPSSEQGLDLYTNDSVLDISTQMPITMIDDCASDLCESNYFICQRTPLYLEYASLSSPSKSSNSSWVSTKCSNNDEVCEEDDLFSSQQTPVTLVGADLETEYGQNKCPVDLSIVSAATEEEQCGGSPSGDRNQHCNSGHDISVPDMENHNLVGTCHPPERLLSTRKVISPNSQERLCQAMKVEDMIEDDNDYKCKGKLNFADAIENKFPTNGKRAENAKVDIHLQTVGAVVNGSKEITTGPKRSSIKKISPPKANQKSSKHSRSLPNFSTGSTSLTKCKESAIAFSQMQMHDFENLATKLMTELKSMKEIVEVKLHHETSPVVDEVKLAIKRANKTEERTRKWLSMMTRDCNRFCTIMKEPEKSEVGCSDKTHKERRKITFADEVGGVLCQVKLFDDGMVP